MKDCSTNRAMPGFFITPSFGFYEPAKVSAKYHLLQQIQKINFSVNLCEKTFVPSVVKKQQWSYIQICFCE